MRKFMLLITMLALLVFAAAPMAMAEKGPIKIGFIAPATGNFAQMGQDMIAGFKMYLEEIGYKVDGRKIQLIVEDEGGKPNIAVAKARKLIKNDKVDLIAGVFMTSAAYAVAPVCKRAGIPLIITLSAGDDLTQRKRSKYVTRVSFTGSELGMVAGTFAYKKLGWRKADCLAMDYAWGHENVGAFQRSFEALGGKVIQKIWTPVNTADFGPYVANIKREADGIYDVVTGGASIRFIKALRNSGLMAKMEVMTAGTGTDESLLPALGDTALGIYSVFNWSAVLDTPENKAWVAKVRKATGKEAPMGMAICYDGAKWIINAIKEVHGDVENKEAFLKAVRKVELPRSLRGPLKMDDYGHVIQNVYIRQVEKVDGKLQNSIVATYPMASQFNTIAPEKYLKTPVNSRSYPPCKHCK
jgi:branched-chain amino acid transport system substrate-binding protein